MENYNIVTSIDDENSFLCLISKLHIDYLILRKFHWNICIFKDFKGVGNVAPLVQIDSIYTRVQIGLKDSEQRF